jgi:hypothetical protein
LQPLLDALLQAAVRVDEAVCHVLLAFAAAALPAAATQLAVVHRRCCQRRRCRNIRTLLCLRIPLIQLATLQANLRGACSSSAAKSWRLPGCLGEMLLGNLDSGCKGSHHCAGCSSLGRERA